jgi:NADH-quinone oxidoreductase subunit J
LLREHIGLPNECFCRAQRANRLTEIKHAMRQAVFFLLGGFTLVSALAAAMLPRLIHGALAFAAAFVGIAAIFFLLGAEFVGLVQVFVYIGAVAILIVFTILLTPRDQEKSRGLKWGGMAVAAAVFVGLVMAIGEAGLQQTPPALSAELTVKHLGEVLMSEYVWPLLGVGVLLTVALLGALILAMEEKA